MQDSILTALSAKGFGLNNLPWGVFSRDPSAQPSIGVALGDNVVDVAALQRAGLLTGPVLSRVGSCLSKESLNEFMSLGRPAWSEARATLQRLLSAQEGVIRDDPDLQQRVFIEREKVTMHMPADIGDYTDFYASRQHAFNCGALFRGPGQELQPNWVHLPVGYHGRSSSIVPSGIAVRRPWGQVMPAGSSTPTMAPCAALDYEMEMGCFIGVGNKLGDPIKVDQASNHIFGMVLLNDWSARDIQKWESLPLGPFNSKNFATQISPWIVTYEALEPFTCAAPVQDPEVLPYMREQQRRTFNIQLTTDIVPSGTKQACCLSHTNFNTMYYTWEQMLAHHTLGGCRMRPGDLLGSGTVSGGPDGQKGCLFEASLGGKQTLELRPAGRGSDAPAVAKRVYLEDGDEVVMSGWCAGPDNEVALSFGECRGVVLPALNLQAGG